jgi:hypothetical protein
MTIRIEIRTVAVCEDCGYEWEPTMYIGADNALKSLSLECPQCKEALSAAGIMIRRFDPVVNLLG